MALGTGVLTGLTAAVVLSTSSPAFAAGPYQTADCAFGSPTASPYVTNQVQGSTLVPFMMLNGTAVTPGTTQIAVACVGTGAHGFGADSELIVGISSPIAAFNDHFTGYGLFATNEFMGGIPSTVTSDSLTPSEVGAQTTGGDSQSTVLSSGISAGATSLPLGTYSDVNGDTGTGFPGPIPSGSQLFIGTPGGVNEIVETTAIYNPGASSSISVTATSNAYPSGAPVIQPYLFTIPSSGANDTDAVCPTTQAQVDLGLTNCAMAVADTAADEYGFGYVNYSTTTTWPASTPVPSTTGLTNPPDLVVNNVTVPSDGSSALAGNTVQLTSIGGTAAGFTIPTCTSLSLPAGCGAFWGDPDGSLSEPLQVQVQDSAGTEAVLNTTNTMGSGSPPSNLSIVPDVYYPSPCTPSNPLSCTVVTGSGGFLTGGMLEAQARVGANPSSTGAALTEVIPAEGFNPTTGAATPWTPGSFDYAVLEPNVAPASDSPFDTATVACTTTCPVPGTSPVTQVATLTAAASAGATTLSVSTGLPAMIAGLPIALGTASGTHEAVFLTSPVVANATTINVTPTVNAYSSGAPVSSTALPVPLGSIGVALGTLLSQEPSAPTLVSAVPTADHSVALTWTAPSSSGASAINGYDVYEGTSSGHESATPFNSSLIPSTQFTYTVTPLTDGTPYFFTVEAQNNQGNSPASNELSATPEAPGVSSPPIGLQATGGNGSVSLSWTAPSSNGGSSITGYNVYEGTSAGHESASAVNGATLIAGTTYTVPGLTNGTTYYFTVEAMNGTGLSNPSGEASATPAVATAQSSPPTVPDPPTQLGATASNGQVSLNWSPPSFDGGAAVAGYEVYDGTTSGAEGATALNSSLVTGTTYTVTGLTNGTKYFFTVKAVNSVGSSAASSETSATPSGPPAPPPPPTTQCSSYTGNDAFLCSAYEDLLGRAPDAGGLSFWGTQLSSGASRSSVAYGILTSTESRDHLVASDYQTFLGRAPDPAGLSYWIAQLNGGASDESVLAGIMGSAEFYTHSGGTADGFITAAYTDLLGRAPDSGGLAYWEALLSSGASQSSVIAGILSSTEYRSDFVQSLYSNLLGRNADPGGLSYWVGQLASGASDETVISGIVGSAEYYTRATS
jgi:hypothetical protein